MTDPKAADALLTVAGAANDAQKAAIGAGLAEAAQILAPPTRRRPRRSGAGRAVGIGALVTAFIAASSATVTRGWNRRGGGGGASPGGLAAASMRPARPRRRSVRRLTPIFSGANSSGGGMTAVIQSSVSPSRTSM